MTRVSSLSSILIAGCLSALGPGAQAETWADTRHVTLVDVDSIHRGPDGLVYYRERDKYGDDRTPRTGAYDCVKRLGYSSYRMDLPDWRTKGDAVLPGTMGQALLDFVCSRVK